MIIWPFLIFVCIIVIAAFCIHSSKQSKIARNNEEAMTLFAHTQLIGGDRFLEQYATLLSELHADLSFRAFILSLRRQLNSRELTDTKAANAIIANHFYHTSANAKYPAVGVIANQVRSYGKQASAHISIYYAMYIYDRKPYTPEYSTPNT